MIVIFIFIFCLADAGFKDSLQKHNVLAVTDLVTREVTNLLLSDQASEDRRRWVNKVRPRRPASGENIRGRICAIRKFTLKISISIFREFRT